MNQTDSDYRPDIDGLRAVAVLAVLVFHAFPAALVGGFVGVDVFFVISGFLITSILVREIGSGRFSILRFYVRRARRLFPALLAMMLVCTLGCWFVLLGFEWQNFGKHLAAGAAYVSNILLWREVGYFDPQAESKPLLHLWSLGVEEQFYLVWPLLLWGMFRLLRWKPLWVTLALCLLSLLLCVVLTRSSQPTAFYLPATRFWELAIGGLLAMAVSGTSRPTSDLRQPLANLCGVLGIALVAWSVLRPYPAGTFPGVSAALPVVGAVLIILAGPASALNRHFLGSAPMVYVGRISYPLYLWHWPLLSLAFLVQQGVASAGLRLALLVAAFVLAAATEKFVERPFRARLAPERALSQARYLWIATCAVGAAGVVVWAGRIPSRAEGSPAGVSTAAAMLDWSAPEAAAIPGAAGRRVLLLGDSHMQQYWPRVESTARAASGNLPTIEMLTSSGCAPIPGLARVGNPCDQFFSRAMARAMRADVNRVVMAASWAGLATRNDLYLADDASRTLIDFLGDAGRGPLQQWTRELAALRAAGKEVVVVLSSPRGELVRPERHFDRWRARATGAPQWAPRTDLHQVVEAADDAIRAAAVAAGARVVEPFESMCTAAQCRIADEEIGPYYIDESHLRATYVSRHAKFIDDLLR